MSREMKDSGIEWIGEIPKDWILSRLKDYYKFEKGKNAALYTQEYIGINKGEFPVYSGQTENDGVMGFINRFDYDLDECLFTTTVGAKVMTQKILKGKFSLSQNCLIMNQIKECNNKFIFYILNPLFNYEKSLIPTYMQPSLRMSDLNKYQFYLPTIKEQNKFANFLDEKVSEIDNIIKETTQSIEEYKKYKQSIITEALTKGINPNVKMKDSGINYIGKIPVDWNVKRLRYLGTLQNGISKSSDYFGYGFPFVSYSDVYKNMELPLNGSGLIDSNETERENYSVKQGDVFFTRTSETIEEVGFASTCLKTIKDAVFAGFLIRFRPINDELNINYSKYYFRSEMHRRFFVKEMNLVTRASLSQELLKKLPVIIPPEVEQQKIAEYLDKKCSEIDSIISQKEQLLLDINAFKKSLIYECVTGKREV